MSDLKVSVNYWEYSDGGVEYIGKSGTYPTGWRSKRDKGFYCWAVPTNNTEFIDWMTEIARMQILPDDSMMGRQYLRFIYQMKQMHRCFI